MLTEPAISVRDLRKSFGSAVALDGVSMEVARGSIVAVLGPNGSGKTTLVRILTTSLAKDAGAVRVLGLPVDGNQGAIRRRIGVSGQFSAVDSMLTGLENLELVARFNHLPRQAAARRAEEMLERFELGDVRHSQVRTYSGGMRRRLDIACALIAAPEILFLDEPTTGLDPRSRMQMWNLVREMATAGTTVLLTTQYLEEADYLADDVTVINAGRVVASGTPDELKRSLGSDRLEVRFSGPREQEAARSVVSEHGFRPLADPELHTLVIDLPAGTRSAMAVLAALEKQGLDTVQFAVRSPSLDDVFLAMTGDSA